MEEHPIIFSIDMVRVTLEGSKTQTRRVVKPQPMMATGSGGKFLCWAKLKFDEGVLANDFGQRRETYLDYIKSLCPYGQVGDRLWVRESYWQDQSGGVWCYKAGESQYKHLPDFPPTNCGGKAIPAIFMPRWASRITLEITGLRVERLQEITNKDAIAEGISQLNEIPAKTFAYYWDSLNAKRGYGWEANPWVWVIQFKAVK